MKRDTTLLARFDALPLLQDTIENGSSRAKAWARKQVANLLALESTIEQITQSLEMQRWYRNQLDTTKDISPISDRGRETYMAELPHIIPFFALRAFSLPLDYRVPKVRPLTKEMYHAFIDAIVIQPEYLSDDFLLSLGLMSEDEEKSLSLKEKIEKKIVLIPHIKELLHELTPLSIWERRTTGRISRVADPKSPHFGGYIVFQEHTEIENDTEKKRRNMKRKIVARYFKDHYSLIRSQRYATLGLKNKIEFLRKFRDEIIPTILLRWQRTDYMEVDKKTDVADLIAELEWSLAYHERRALEDRIKKIDFQNPEQDRQRLIWACNDIIKATSDKLGKQNEISAQTEWLRDSERQVRSAFELFYDEIMAQIPRLNQSLHSVDPKTMWDNINLSWEQAHDFNSFQKMIQRFHERNSSLPLVGNPFHTLWWLVTEYLEALSEHRRERKWAIGKNGLRLTLSFLLELKKIRFEVMVKEAEYRQKIRWDAMNVREKSNLVIKIWHVRDSLENVRFLPDIELKEGWQKLFEGMISELNRIIEWMRGE